VTLQQTLKIVESPIARELRHAVAISDRLHTCPRLPDVPVEITHSRLEEGAYHSLSRPNRPVKIEVSLNAHAPALTILHEIGHLLDHMVLSPLKQQFGSEYDSNFEQLWHVWRTSHINRKLETLLHRKRSTLSPAQRRYLRYQLLPSELWARTYTQWVVVRSDDILLVSQFRTLQIPETPDLAHRRSFFWDGQDRDRIINAADDLFSRAGLR